MRVLMLGWEFPPHISGGLGTACFGLTRGLMAHGVEVLFVIPRTTGDEQGASHVEIVGANQVPMPRARIVAAGSHGSALTIAEDADHHAALSAATDVPSSSSASLGQRGLERLLELLAIDSPLRAYDSAASYAAATHPGVGVATPGAAGASSLVLEQLRRALLGDPDSGRSPVVSEVVAAIDAATHAAATNATSTADVTTDTWSFSGGYGHDLMGEIARYALVVAELARTQSFDVVHAHDWLAVPAGVAAARVSGKPLVLQIHASEYDRSGEHVNSQVREIEQLGLTAADRVVCVSHFTAALVERRYQVDARKLRVVHNAVNHAERARAWQVEKSIPEPIVLFLGRVTFQKGPDYFLEAAALVVKIEPRVKFVMSGSGDMLPAMVERCARLGLARHVHFTGFLRGTDVERMYAMADIFVMPSVSEPFGITPLEAVALDVPVIVSRQSGVSEILNNALKVDFWDVEDLANKILALLRYPSLTRHLVEEGREEIRRFKWEQQGGLMRDIYRELVA